MFIRPSVPSFARTRLFAFSRSFVCPLPSLCASRDSRYVYSFVPFTVLPSVGLTSRPSVWLPARLSGYSPVCPSGYPFVCPSGQHPPVLPFSHPRPSTADCNGEKLYHSTTIDRQYSPTQYGIIYCLQPIGYYKQLKQVTIIWDIQLTIALYVSLCKGNRNWSILLAIISFKLCIIRFNS